MTTNQIIIRITGDSGDGVQLLGEQLTITAALEGRDVRSLPDFPAEIRAPAGTVAGVSGFQLAMSKEPVFTAGETLDVLVALNPAGLKNSLSFLKPGGLLLINENSFTDKDWQKANLSPSFLDSVKDQYDVILLPLISQSIKALESIEISHAQAKKSKNFYILGFILWLFDFPTGSCLSFIKKKFKVSPAMIKANEMTLLAGYNYAMTLELCRKHFTVGEHQREPGAYRQITGVEAVSLALSALTVGTGRSMLVSGYPITPSSAILHECARLEEFGISLLQAEDEIAAICACLGASFGGCLAMTCTSGPGLDLKTEGLGLAVMAELPLVVIDVQRAGASTGLPTKTGQSDLRQACFGRHGEAPLPVLAARSPGDCFYTVLEAFSLAVRLMTPVIVLMDAFVANAAEPWKIPQFNDLKIPEIDCHRFPEPYQRDEHLSRSWNPPGMPGFIHHTGGLEKQGAMGHISYDADNYQHMVQLRAQKISNAIYDYPVQIEGARQSEILLIGWGSTYGSLKAAVLECQSEGIEVALLHLKLLNPLPDLKDVLTVYKTVLVAELNSGHLCQMIRAQFLTDAKPLLQCNGQPFSVAYLVKAIREYSHVRDSIHS